MADKNNSGGGEEDANGTVGDGVDDAVGELQLGAGAGDDDGGALEKMRGGATSDGDPY